MAIPKNTPISATSEKPKPDEKKATEAVKAATDSKAAPAASPVKPNEKKPAEASKTATDGKAAPSVSPVKPDEKKPAEDTKTATDGKAAPAAPADKSDEKKPAEVGKTATDGKTAPAAPAAKPDEKKPAETTKTAADGKTAPAAPAAKPDEKKPAEATKTATDGKAAPATPAATKPDEKNPAEASKTAADGKTAPAAPTDKPDEKKPAESSKVVNFPASADKDKSKAEKPDAPDENEYNDPKDVKLSIGADEKDRVTMAKLSDLHKFEGHPFKVEDNEDMKQLVESVKQFGVMEPIVAIPRKEGGLEIVSGHRRKRAAELAGLSLVPVIVRDLDRDEATISMVDANLKRENISPMEKARAYAMKLEAMKRKAGRRSKTDILTGKEPIRADEQLAQQTGESRATIQRIVRLNNLEPELQKMVDEKKLPVNTAADLSYLKKDEQKEVIDAIQKEDKVPSGAQAAEMKKDSQAGKLTSEKIQNTVAPTKKEMQPPLKVTLTEEELRPYFPDKRTTVPDVKSGIFDALKLRKAAIERQKAKAEEAKAAAKTPAKPSPAKSTASKTPAKPSLKR